ncbi:hypothetical protein I316_03204 [Kwoniella heveanensis BCC8398]|uniref:V-type ATPase assembly factor PKR1 n=1 Tax=Kwoniella heveanensis BCC8398 TaxID=1296120 RepID=A0A1B9GVV9_9TREE|nr:hypothetical protein I316_03204 [Kwoniella heveanensis BCC8398]
MVTKSSTDSSSSSSEGKEITPPPPVSTAFGSAVGSSSGSALTTREQATAELQAKADSKDVNQDVAGAAGDASNDGQPGFFGLLIKSVFEPGANAAVVMAMNLCFFFLLLTLFGLYVLTGWNKHVLLLLGVTTLLWGSMVWFVMELTKVQNRPDNMPPSLLIDGLDGTPSTPGDKQGQSEISVEPKKDR